MFSSGAKDKAEEFEGGRTAPDIVSFALEKLAENVPAPDIVEVIPSVVSVALCRQFAMSCHVLLKFQNNFILLEKVLLDPIFMILKFDLSSRSLGHVMFSFAGTAQEAGAGIPVHGGVNRDTSCPRSTTSSCFLSSSRERKHHVTKASR